MKDFKGNKKQKKMAGWIANLMIQRGFAYALGSNIDIGLNELTHYFGGHDIAGDQHELADLLEDSIAANAHLFFRYERDDEVVFSASKRKLVDLLQEEKPQVDPAPALKIPKGPGPGVSSAAELPPVSPDAAVIPTAVSEEVAPAEEEPAPAFDEPDGTTKPMLSRFPVTQQYQLSVLLAMCHLGGSGKTSDVMSIIPKMMELPSEHRGTYARGPKGESEEPKYIKFVHSARRFLLKQGELESPSRGVWAITAAGEERLRQAGFLT